MSFFPSPPYFQICILCGGAVVVALRLYWGLSGLHWGCIAGGIGVSWRVAFGLNCWSNALFGVSAISVVSSLDPSFPSLQAHQSPQRVPDFIVAEWPETSRFNSSARLVQPYEYPRSLNKRKG